MKTEQGGQQQTPAFAFVFYSACLVWTKAATESDFSFGGAMRALRSDSVILLLPSFSIYQYCFVGKASQSLNHLESYIMPFRSSSAWYVAESKASMEILIYLKNDYILDP